MKIRFLLIIFFFVSVMPATAEMTSPDLSKPVQKDIRHPYLFFSENDKPAILERIKTDPQSHEIVARLLAEANRLLQTPVEPIPPEPKDKGPQLFDTSGNFAQIYYSYRTSAYNLAFVYQLTGDEKYARKSYDFAKEVCDMPSWVMRFCQFPKAYYRVSPWNVTDDKVVFTFDIISSDTASMIAAVYDWIYPVLTRDERDWIRGGLLKNAILQVRGNYDYQWWSTAYRCNWCAWCNTGLGLAALALLTEDPGLADVVAESYNRISRTLDHIDPDGGWQEGGGYWAQTMRMSILFGDALKRFTNGEYDLFKHPKITTNPVNFPLYLSVPPDKSVNFEDSGNYRIGSPRLYNKIALETGNQAAAWISDTWYGGGDDIFDVIWPRNNVKPELPQQASIHFRSIDWVIMRSDFTDPDKVMIACKAGKNDDPHHGHLDVGQFVVYWKGTAFISDHGPAGYDEKYFDEEKYNTPQASSIGHNLIFVNGERQISGKRFRQPANENIGGKILEFRPGKARDYILLDASNAYPKKELKKWRRHIILEKPVVTVILDEVESSKDAEIEARFHSEADQQVKNGFTLLHGKNGDMAIIPVTDEKFVFRPDSHPYLALQKQASFLRIPYNGTILKAEKEYTVISHIILPVVDESEALGVVKSAKQSGAYILSFVYKGKKYEYRFKKENEGLVLEK
jgi:hypothetical protein